MNHQRVIKFRVWDEKKMCYDNNPILVYPEEGLIRQGRIIQQYTGQKDKNGREICEGDIISIGFHVTHEHYGVVIFEYGSFLLLNPISGSLWPDTTYQLQNGYVYGNILECPNLVSKWEKIKQNNKNAR